MQVLRLLALLAASIWAPTSGQVVSPSSIPASPSSIPASPSSVAVSPSSMAMASPSPGSAPVASVVFTLAIVTGSTTQDLLAPNDFSGLKAAIKSDMWSLAIQSFPDPSILLPAYDAYMPSLTVFRNPNPSPSGTGASTLLVGISQNILSSFSGAQTGAASISLKFWGSTDAAVMAWFPNTAIYINNVAASAPSPSPPPAAANSSSLPAVALKFYLTSPAVAIFVGNSLPSVTFTPFPSPTLSYAPAPYMPPTANLQFRVRFSMQQFSGAPTSLSQLLFFGVSNKRAFDASLRNDVNALFAATLAMDISSNWYAASIVDPNLPVRRALQASPSPQARFCPSGATCTPLPSISPQRSPSPMPTQAPLDVVVRVSIVEPFPGAATTFASKLAVAMGSSSTASLPRALGALQQAASSASAGASFSATVVSQPAALPPVTATPLAPAPSPANNDSGSSSGSNKAGATAGGVIAGILIIGGMCLLCYLDERRKTKNRLPCFRCRRRTGEIRRLSQNPRRGSVGGTMANPLGIMMAPVMGAPMAAPGSYYPQPSPLTYPPSYLPVGSPTQPMMAPYPTSPYPSAPGMVALYPHSPSAPTPTGARV